MTKHNIILQPSGRRGQVEEGTSVRSAARELGVEIESICAENATCGKCMVLIEEGRFEKYNIDYRESLIENATIGRELNIPESIKSVQGQLVAGKHEADLIFDFTDPAVTDSMNGEQLGITGLVHAETSYFYGSDAARVQNIQAAASQFHGLLIAPGETFSMASALGDISLDNGYAEALIIFGNQTIKGVGGGVCQVSTTLFRAAFFAGFPVNERYAHAYRVSYYERVAGGSVDPRLAGLDATD